MSLHTQYSPLHARPLAWGQLWTPWISWAARQMEGPAAPQVCVCVCARMRADFKRCCVWNVVCLSFRSEIYSGQSQHCPRDHECLEICSKHHPGRADPMAGPSERQRRWRRIAHVSMLRTGIYLLVSAPISWRYCSLKQDVSKLPVLFDVLNVMVEILAIEAHTAL